MPHILQRDDLAANLILRKLLAANLSILRMVGTVDAAVYAIVREIQRRKKHDALAVKLFLDLLGKRKHPLQKIGGINREQERRLAMRQPLAVARTHQKALHECTVILIRFRPRERRKDFFMMNEFLGAIVFCHAYAPSSLLRA